MVSTSPRVAIADQMGRHANIEIDGTDVIGGQKEERGATDAITANGESAGTGMINANGVGGTITVTIDGDLIAPAFKA